MAHSGWSTLSPINIFLEIRRLRSSSENTCTTQIPEIPFTHFLSFWSAVDYSCYYKEYKECGINFINYKVECYIYFVLYSETVSDLSQNSWVGAIGWEKWLNDLEQLICHLLNENMHLAIPFSHGTLILAGARIVKLKPNSPKPNLVHGTVWNHFKHQL